ncbi:MAG: hypothetical protein RSJ41_06700 [Clostridia bacterium]
MKYVRRFLWFIASRLLAFSIIVSILILGFYLAMNAANIYILLSDGMELRTQVILMREDTEELNNFFRTDFLSSDEALQIGLSPQSPYLNYKINSFESDVKMEWVWSWPWEDTAQATIVHRVPTIKGSVIGEKSALVKNGQLSATPPSWQGGRYKMTLLRTNGQWKIAGMTQTQVILDPTPTPLASPAA